MKVLLINGSPRVKGNTFTALSEIASQLKIHGIESELLQLGTKPVRGCIACNACRGNALGRCAFDDDACNRVIDMIDSFDALVIGSPVYYGQPAGQVLSLQQRMFHAASHKFENKLAAAVCVCRRGGATAAMQALQMPFQMVNMPLVSSQYWNIVYGREEGQAALDAEGLQTMRTLADNMAWMLRKISTGEGDSPKREPWIPTHFING